ncbi:MAG: ABC transporter permease [Synergistaceae bacterium]|jgi:peptide/nickel transport system permease protein|nr:ABC transporter permease [Synergistaceae bacterium]
MENTGRLLNFFRNCNQEFIVSSLILLLIITVAIFPAWFTRYDPYEQNMEALMQPPSAGHFFGTDNFGRDCYSRVIYGTRVDLVIGVLATAVPFLTGVFIGLVSGYFGGKIDAVMMRILDITTAFPFTVLIILIVSILGTGMRNLYIAIWLVGWREYAKLSRSEVLVEKNAEYVQAAKVLGFSNARILFRHIMPNVVQSSVVYGITDIMLCMLTAAGMSFMGLGVEVPTPEWGAIISEGRPFMAYAWWISTFPGIVLMLTGITINVFGSSVSRMMKQMHGR